MSSVILNPLKEFEHNYRGLHLENTNAFLNALVCRSGIKIEENQKTVKEYHAYKENLANLKKKLVWQRVLRVLMVISIVLIPWVVTKMTPKIRTLRSDIESADAKAEQLCKEAWAQMAPLNKLFTDRDALNIIHQTLPLLSFDTYFSMQKEENMRVNYDFAVQKDSEQSTVEVLSGDYNGNPFLFENKVVHIMGAKIYYGYEDISWTETYTDSDGKQHQRRKTQRLEASVEKPCPYYDTRVVLSYGSQGAPDLSFSREASHLEQKSKRGLELYIKKEEKRLGRKAEKAVGQNDSFTCMSNTKFEVIFHALDRDHEVQFRTLFTPLGQNNMVELILSSSGFGDDFEFIKTRRMNKIISDHSQSRPINITADSYSDFSFDMIKEKFVSANEEFFKNVYFDFAPIWAIPAYHDRPVHSLEPVAQYSQLYSCSEGEVLANAVPPEHMVHPDTKTPAILKSEFLRSQDGADEVRITAYSYDVFERSDIVSVYGDDGKYHDVTVPWKEYAPLEAKNNFFVATTEKAQNGKIMASKDGLCIFKI